jgi:hypothetical protein
MDDFGFSDLFSGDYGGYSGDWGGSFGTGDTGGGYGGDWGGGFDSGYGWGGGDTGGGGYDYAGYDYGGYSEGTVDFGGATDYGSGWGSGFSGDWGSQPSTNAWWSGAGDNNSYALQQAGGYTAGQGQFGANGATGYDTGTLGVTPPTTGNGGVTGAFGVGPQDETYGDGSKATPMLQGSYWNKQGYAADGSGPPQSAMNNGSGPGTTGSIRGFARENADLARLGIGVAGMFAARKDQKRSDQLMEQTLADRAREREMKEEMYRTQLENMRAAQGAQHRSQASQSSAVNRNNAQADYWNRQAQQSGNEARSLYNPQELGIRGYATEAAATGRAVQDTQSRMARQGKSQSAIDAEVRRAKVAGSTNASTGYMKGLDTGRSAQGGALTSAKGLGSNYTALASQSLPSMSMPGATSSNSDLAAYYNDQAGENSNAIQDLLNYYLGDPLGTSNKNQVGVL